MILTEEEAKGKWCPHARVIFNHRDEEKMRTHAATSYNRSSDPMPLSNCIGSGCMAWKWIDSEYLAEADPAVERRGRCGIAV
jgi:hypothetical protein